MRSATLMMLASLAAATSAAAEVIPIDVKNIAFAPARITAHVGDTVEWTNKDFVAHTATAKSGGDWDINLPPQKTGRVIINKAGVVDYYCKYHPNMKGRIEIAPQ